MVVSEVGAGGFLLCPVAIDLRGSIGFDLIPMVAF